jgi:hypothetical protein
MEDLLKRLEQAVDRLNETIVNLHRVGGWRNDFEGMHVTAIAQVVSIQATILTELVKGVKPAETAKPELPAVAQPQTVTPAPAPIATETTQAGVLPKTAPNTQSVRKPRPRLASV